MKKYVLAIDQGTTSSRAILFDHHGNACFQANRDVEALFPNPGWVEEDALKIWVSVIDVVNEVLVMASATMEDIDSIGITNQRETTIIWDKNTGLPVYNAIVWQSRQTNELCNERIEHKDFIHSKTGLLINPYFSASKIRFILDKIPNGQKRAEDGELMFGTVETWLIYKMSKGKLHLTDISNASRTLLFNIFTKSWDEELLKLWNIPSQILPKVVPCSYDYGAASFFSDDVHIRGVAGDQQAALFGQTCFDEGDCKNTYGTGCFMLMNIGENPTLSKLGLLTTVAWEINGKTTYALEGSVLMGGAIVQWLRDGLKIITTPKETEEIASKVKSSDGVYMVPAFVGLGTPYWDDEVRATILGLTRGSTKEHIVRAALEAIAYQVSDVFSVMKEESGLTIKSLKVDGGASVNSLIMQFQSDLLNCEVHLPEVLETTSLGAAFLAGLNSVFWKDFNELKKEKKFQKIYKPKMSNKETSKRIYGWKKAVEAARVFKLNDDR